MSEEIISKKTRRNLELLKKANALNGFYLAGGTGLALQLKHRLSIDLDFEESLKLFKKKYKGIDYNMVHILKSLIYFDDAEKEPMPKMLTPVDWAEVKLFFQKKVNFRAN